MQKRVENSFPELVNSTASQNHANTIYMLIKGTPWVESFTWSDYTNPIPDVEKAQLNEKWCAIFTKKLMRISNFWSFQSMLNFG